MACQPALKERKALSNLECDLIILYQAAKVLRPEVYCFVIGCW